MNIYFIRKDGGELLKAIPYTSVSKKRYDNGELRELYKTYSSRYHAAYIASHQFAEYEIVDGVVTEIIVPEEPYVETSEDRIAKIESSIASTETQIEDIELRILARSNLGMYTEDLEVTKTDLLSTHSDLCFDLAIESM